MTKLCPKFSQK